MMKKIISLILVIALVVMTAACGDIDMKSKIQKGVVSPVPEEGKAVLTILLSTYDYDTIMKREIFDRYIHDFERNFGVDVRLEKLKVDLGRIITAEDQDVYMQKLASKLSVSKGPELILTRSMSMYALIKQQAVLDIRGKVGNIDKIYDNLLDDKVYYAPLGMFYYTRTIKKQSLEKLGIPQPSLDWNAKDFFVIKDKWISNNNTYFNMHEYYNAFEQFINFEGLYNNGDNQIKLSTPEIVKAVKNIRGYIFGGKYKLDEGYKYENYYKMLFEDKSEEFEKDLNYYSTNNENGNIDGGMIANIFRAQEIDEKNKSYETIMYPEFKDRDAFIESYGLLVNRNGKNLDLAYEFINGLLSDEVQMRMFENKYDDYPVNKDIEADILKLEGEQGLDPTAIQLKAYGLQELKAGRCKVWATLDNKKYKLSAMLYKDFAKLILADNPYSDEQLAVELKKMEDKYNIWLNE